MSRARVRMLALLSYAALITVIALWELVLLPVHSVSPVFWFLLKDLPLIAGWYGLWRGAVYTFTWTGMLILMYFVNGVMITVIHRRDGLGWHSPLVLGILTLTLSLVFFVLSLQYLRLSRPSMAQGPGSG